MQYNPTDDILDKQNKLVEWKKQRPEMKDWNNHLFSSFLYHSFGRPFEEQKLQKDLQEERDNAYPRCREENRQRKEQEIRLVKELVNKAEDYRIAKEIREYIQAMIDSGNEDITPEWIEWALKKADWYDPSIATEDEYLGKRQHEKSVEEKEKSLQDSIRKSWYW